MGANMKLQTRTLAKLMTYMLGNDPTEFGLVPDKDNRFKIRDVLKALHDTDDFRNIREGDFKELAITTDKPAIAMEDGFIWATDISRLVAKKPAENPPKILYTAVRSRSHAHILREGVLPVGAPYVLLSPHKDMALKIGRRIDNEPLLLEVKPYACMDEGIVINEVGGLFIADYLPVTGFNAPPLPKEQPAKPKTAKPKTQPEPPKPALNAGSFFLDLHDEAVSKEEKMRRAQKDKQLKKDRQIARRQKQYRNEDFE